MKVKRYILSLSLMLAFLCSITARASESVESETFNVKEAIFEHLLDTYEWELPFTHEVITLPVIVKDFKDEWHIFDSRRLYEDGEYNGFRIAQDGENAGKIEGVDDKGNHYRPTDLSMTKNVTEILLASLLMLLIFFPMVRWYKKNPYKAPRRFLGSIELLVDMVYGEVIKPILGKDARRFAPYLLTVFFFILVVNLLGMITVFPGGANISGNLAVTMVLAFMTFLVVNIFGTRHYLKELFWPEVPMWMKFPIPLMPVIEVFGAITKPVALMIRLFANMLGGHMITLVLVALIFIFSALGVAVQSGTAVFSVVFALFMGVLHLLICLIQAYVFTMLSTIFIGLAQERGHVDGEKKKKK
ncbi:MAG: F0F1 ATP synthase subunit A [Bacteroidales bacterium]